jgi:two-component system OmpR family sensor kinase
MKRSPLQTLTGRLIALFAVLTLLLAVLYLAVTVWSTRTHLQAVDQSLNLGVAATIRDRHFTDASFDPKAIPTGAALTALMSLNPNAEIYVLDAAGLVLAHAAPAGRLLASSVATAPIAALASGGQALPVYGEDPRDPNRPKVFSAAPIWRSGALFGYVYVVLGGEAYASATDMFRASHILRLSAGLLAGGFAAVLVLGALSFQFMTAPLRRLTSAVASFEPGESAPLMAFGNGRRDEIGVLARSFQTMAQRIREQVFKLKTGCAARREFMVHISHDLKTPVASIHGYLETLVMKWEELPARQRELYFSSALKATEQISLMIDAIFELARLEGPDAPLKYELFSMTELIQDTCQKLRLEAEASQVALVVNWDAQNVYGNGDIGLIERALVNVIQNAIKYSPPGSDVQITARLSDDRVLVSVANRGPVIRPDEIERLFVPLYRTDGARQTTKGSGLGLTITRRIVELHGGAIAATSSEAQGTRFDISLPA